MFIIRMHNNVLSKMREFDKSTFLNTVFQYNWVCMLSYTRYKIQDTRILFRYHRLTIEYNEIYIYTISVKNKDQTNSK